MKLHWSSCPSLTKDEKIFWDTIHERNEVFKESYEKLKEYIKHQNAVIESQSAGYFEMREKIRLQEEEIEKLHKKNSILEKKLNKEKE
jgi:beta-N-acetylglucosaminidase